MCGIAGILRVYDPGEPVPPPLVSIPEAWLDVLDDSIKHRGPDGRGRFRDRVIRREDGATVDVALVHRRLSIIDHAGGHQPMVSVRKGAGVIAAKRASGPGWLLYEDPSDPAISAWAERASSVSSSTRAGSASDRTESQATPVSPAADDLIAVVFNGCIYNHRELRRELQAVGHAFTSDHSDTEVLVHGWREWGGQLMSRVDGMFGVVVWNRHRGDLVVLRDRAGEKPLYARADPLTGVSVVSSALPAIVRLARDSASLPNHREGILQNWIRFGFGLPLPLGADECLPGVCRGVAHSRTLGESALPAGRRSETSLEGQSVESLLDASIRPRLESDVPIGCFLSGGIDSSLVAAVARKHVDVQTFCVRMPVEGFDESPIASAVARHLNTRHATLEVESNPARDLLEIIPQVGLPFGDSSLLPTLWLARAVRQHSAVALSGDGGDELFVGYERHRAAQMLQRHRRALSLVPTRLLPSRRPRSLPARARRFASVAATGNYFDLLAIFDSTQWLNLCSSIPPPAPAPEAELETDAPRADFRWYLPLDLLRKVDSASMAVALEVRSPFLSRALIDACLSEPLSSLMPRGQRKGLLKQVARKYLPADIVDRPKQGFAIPIGEWFRTDYGGLRQMLLDHLLGPEPFGPDSLGINSMINMDFVRQMLKEHDDAGVASIWPWKGRDHSQRLYMLLVLSIWAKWLGGLSGQSPPRMPQG